MSNVMDQPNVDVVCDDVWQAEIARRVADIKAGRAIGRDIDLVLADIRKRHPEA